MRTLSRCLVLALLAQPVWASELQVKAHGALVDVVANGAQLQEILAQLARQTGMKVVYDGVAPRTPITVSLPQRTPLEAVLSLFEGVGLNYVIKMDQTGTRIDTLIVAGFSSGGGATASRGSAPAPPQVPAFRMPAPQPQQPQEAQAEEEQPEEAAAEDEQQPQGQATPVPPFSFSEPIPGPGKPGSPFGGGAVSPLVMPTPVPPPAPGAQAQPGAPGQPAPAASPTPRPESD